jgi:hypothetical protein
MKLIKPVTRIALFGTFLVIGLWMAKTIHDPFQDSSSSTPQFSINTGSVEQSRLLLIVVDKITMKPALQSAWWIGSRVDIPTAMVSIYPSITQQTFRDNELSQTFSLAGLWNSRKPNHKFLDLLSEWDIHWNDYLIIDLAVQSAIIDQIGGVTIDGSHQSGDEVNHQIKKISNTDDQLSYQSRLWSTICSYASQNPEGFVLDRLPLNLNNHILTSIDRDQPGSFQLFPSQPTFPVCMVNAGLIEAAKPPILPTK